MGKRLFIALCSFFFAHTASAGMCDSAFVEALRDKFDFKRDVDIQDEIRSRVCRSYKEKGSSSLGLELYDIIGFNSKSSSEEIDRYCREEAWSYKFKEVEQRASSSLSPDAIKLLTLCQPEGLQVRMLEMNDKSVKIRASFVDQSSNTPQNLILESVSPANVCEGTVNSPSLGPQGQEIACKRSPEAAKEGLDLTFKFKKLGTDEIFAQKVVHVPQDKFVRVEYRTYRIRSRGQLFARCAELGASPPKYSDGVGKDIRCTSNVCKLRPNLIAFCEMTLGYARRISPSGNAPYGISDRWQAEPGPGRAEVTCKRNADPPKTVSCALGPTHCRNQDIMRALCYDAIGPTEVLPN